MIFFPIVYRCNRTDESSEEVFEKLKKSGLSLGENCLLGGKSVLEAIQDGNFERNKSIILTIVFAKANDKGIIRYLGYNGV